MIPTNTKNLKKFFILRLITMVFEIKIISVLLSRYLIKKTLWNKWFEKKVIAFQFYLNQVRVFKFDS